MKGDRNATAARRHAANQECMADSWEHSTAGSVRGLTPGQLAATQMAMALLVQDDLARGVPRFMTKYCPGCDAARPLPGFVLYDRASADAFVCNACATEYEVSRMERLVQDICEFLSGKTDRDTAPALARA